MSLLPPQPPATPLSAAPALINPNANSIFSSGGATHDFQTPRSEMDLSPDKNARRRTLLGGDVIDDGTYRPVAYRTEGARLACLVNASVTVCGEDSIYAFGGFDQYTDEVFNHVLKLNLNTFTWTLVDNYGDIPSVRMGHTTTYWKDDKLIIFGGENEQRVFLSDIYIFDIATATWSQPVISGHPPSGRSRHAVVLHDDKLFILGGIHNNPVAQPAEFEEENDYNPQEILDDICYLDLKTMTWSRCWKWVARFDHQAWVREEKLYIFGGMGKEMDKTGELVTLDLTHPVFARSENKASGYTTRQPRAPSDTATTGQGRVLRSHRSYGPNSPRSLFGGRRNTPPPKPNMVPAASTSIRFLWGKDIPSEAHGTHFHHLCGTTLLDFVTVAANTIRAPDTGLSALDIKDLSWKKISDGIDLLGGNNWRWHYLAIAPNSTKAYLLGCSVEDEVGEGEEFLSDVLPIDLTRFGVNVDIAPGDKPGDGMLGFDLGKIFDREDSGSDFVVRTIKDEAAEGDEYDISGVWGRSVHTPDINNQALSPTNTNGAPTDDEDLPPANVLAPPIRVHKLILLSRWRHFSTLYNSRMREFHNQRLYLPEPYTVVRGFLYYLYTDSLAPSPYCPTLSTVAGLLVMANLYDMPRLRTLCLHRLHAELDVDSAAVVWERAGVAGEEVLRRKAAQFVLTYWGRVVRTHGFRKLSRRSLMELCEEVDEEGRVMGGEELGGLGVADGGAPSPSVAGGDAGKMDDAGAMVDDEDEEMA
ncbi:hypothetical protein EDC01DRAFT_188221 [Geopyxis carbonaria]|nr:hypothetical protein EDC01DRAFT_188221 [Geopyxis carbonaria]